jgi:hypothetical protein
MAATSEDQSHLSWSWNQVLFPLRNENQDSESLEPCPPTGSHLLHKGRSFGHWHNRWAFIRKIFSKFGVEALSDAVQRCLKSAVVEIGPENSLEVPVIQGKIPSLHCQSGFLQASASAVAPRLLAFFLKTAFVGWGLARSAVRGQSVV